MKQVFRRSLMLGAAAMVSLSIVGGASAATLALGGNAGTGSTLPALTFDVVALGLSPGVTPITYFDSLNTNGGLYALSNMTITFEYLGKEAGNFNESRFFAGVGGEMFNTLQSVPQSTGVIATNTGAIPFLFRTDNACCGGGGPLDANNGGTVDSPTRIAFAKFSDSVWYALFDDGGGGNDGDFDDMVLRITATDITREVGQTPLPAAVWLFGTVLAGGAGVGRWRKRKKDKALVTTAA